LNSLAAVIHKNKRNAAGNSEKFVHPWQSITKLTVYRSQGKLFHRVVFTCILDLQLIL